MPSIPRSISRVFTSLNKVPAALASASTPCPTHKHRRKPSHSQEIPNTKPKHMPASCTSDIKKPDWTQLMSRSWLICGKAGDSLPTCMAAKTPVSTTNHDARMAPACTMDKSEAAPPVGMGPRAGAWGFDSAESMGSFNVIELPCFMYLFNIRASAMLLFLHGD